MIDVNVQIYDMLTFPKWNKQRLNKPENRIHLTQHFWSNEFQCKCGSEQCDTVFIRPHHLYNLELYRQLIEMPVYITSGNRCPEHNVKVGGVRNSRHLLIHADATDIHFGGTRITDEHIQLARDIFIGVGIYLKENFLHVDSRNGEKRVWKG